MPKIVKPPRRLKDKNYQNKLLTDPVVETVGKEFWKIGSGFRKLRIKLLKENMGRVTLELLSPYFIEIQDLKNQITIAQDLLEKLYLDEQQSNKTD